MYSKEQKDIALRIYHQTESVTETIRINCFFLRCVSIERLIITAIEIAML